MSSKDKGKGKKTGASGIGGCDEEEEEEGRVDCRFPSILDGKSITLKSPPSQEDDGNVARLLSKQANMRHLVAMAKTDSGGWSEQDGTRRRQQQEVDQTANRGWFCVIKTLDTDDFIGICGLRSVDWTNQSAEMGIIVDEEYWGRGVSMQAHLLCLSHAFENLHLHRVTFVTATENAGMRAFCERAIFATHEGTLRDMLARSWSDPSAGFQTMEIYSLLSGEWEKAKASLSAKIEALPGLISGEGKDK